MDGYTFISDMAVFLSQNIPIIRLDCWHDIAPLSSGSLTTPLFYTPSHRNMASLLIAIAFNYMIAQIPIILIYGKFVQCTIL